MRSAGFDQEKVLEFERRSRAAKWFFAQGWFNLLGMAKWTLLQIVNLWRPLGMVPVSRQGLFKWATKNTSLACENLMIAAEALGLNSCPMEGFDGRRLSKLLGLSPRFHEIVMVIAVGKKSSDYVCAPQWRRPIENTVSFL